MYGAPTTKCSSASSTQSTELDVDVDVETEVEVDSDEVVVVLVENDVVDDEMLDEVTVLVDIDVLVVVAVIVVIVVVVDVLVVTVVDVMLVAVVVVDVVNPHSANDSSPVLFACPKDLEKDTNAALRVRTVLSQPSLVGTKNMFWLGSSKYWTSASVSGGTPMEYSVCCRTIALKMARMCSPWLLSLALR